MYMCEYVCAVRVYVCVRERRGGGGDKERVHDQSSIIGTVKYEISCRYDALVEPFQCWCYVLSCLQSSCACKTPLCATFAVWLARPSQLDGLASQTISSGWILRNLPSELV